MARSQVGMATVALSMLAASFASDAMAASAWRGTRTVGTGWGRDSKRYAFPGYPGGPDSPDDPDSPAEPSWPSWPGGPTAPAAAPLGIRSGEPVHLVSYVLRTTCRVAPANAPVPHALQCGGGAPEGGDSELVLTAADGQLTDGSLVELRVRRGSWRCSVGTEQQRFAVTCDGRGPAGPSSEFVVRQAVARNDLYYLAPATSPSHRCYPSHSPVDPNLQDAASQAGDQLAALHVLVCDGLEDGDQPMMHLMPAHASTGGPISGWLSRLVSSTVTVLEKLVTQVTTALSSDKDDKDNPAELPFGVGSTIILSDPSQDADGLDCDVTVSSPWASDSGYAAATSSAAPVAADPLVAFSSLVRYVLRSMLGGGCKRSGADHADAVAAATSGDKRADGPEVGNKKSKHGGGGGGNDSPLVHCDHTPSPTPSYWKTGGFMVFADYTKYGPVHEGDAVDLRSQTNFKYCAALAVDKHVISCAQADKDNESKFVFYLAPLDLAHQRLQTLRAAGKAVWDPMADQVPVYVKHVASDTYCAAATAKKHAPLACKYDLEDAPVLWLKVHKPYPGGPALAPVTQQN